MTTLSRVLKVAILVTDVPMAEVCQRRGDYYTMFTRCLQQAGRQLYPPVTVETEGFDVVNEPFRYPENPSAWDAILITGSKADSYRDLPWITRLVDYVRTTVPQYPQLKWLGICFGHQIIARAFGVTPEVSPLGWEVGPTTVKLTDTGRQVLDAPTYSSLTLLQLHRDVVEGCPEGFQVLGYSNKCSNHSMVKGNQVLTVQGHPEFTNDVVEVVVRARRETGAIPRDVADACLEKISDNNDSLWFTARMLRFVLGE